MFLSPPGFLAPYGIEENNIWITYLASYLGAIIGGVLSGLFTYLGVKKTIEYQTEKSLKNRRAILEINELYGSRGLYLENEKIKNKRLVMTPEYENAIKYNLRDEYFNYIHIHNSGPGKAFNCYIKVITEEYENKDTLTREVRLPVIFEKENVFIPIDILNITDYKLISKRYFIKNILVIYETEYESIKIERNTNRDNIIAEKASIDKYYIKEKGEKEYKPLFQLEGSKVTWIYLD